VDGTPACGPTALPGRLERHLEASRLIETPARAVVAVSGGADSVALLDLLAGVAAASGLELVVAHADHGIQPGSAAVAALVRELAGRYGLPFTGGELRLGAAASETRARQERYRFLRSVQAERQARYLVTAHHADDQAETVLLRLLRGSAPAGLAGIPPRGQHGLVRPLLPFTRAELLEYTVARALPYHDDPANAELRHTRSWVRHCLIPVIRERLGPAGTEALVEVSDHAREELAAWDGVVDALTALHAQAREGHFKVARAPLRDYDNALAARILRAIARRAGIRLAPRAAQRLARFAAAGHSGRRSDLGEGLEAELAFDTLVVRQEKTNPPAPAAINGSDGRINFGAWEIAWRTGPAPERLERAGLTSWFPATARLTVRPPGGGERLRPLGGVGHRLVRRLLMEARVPRGERASYPLVVCDDAVLWVPGVCRADAVLPAPGTLALRLDVSGS
jgi:tRNA(Ile)-lysidine synthase